MSNIIDFKFVPWGNGQIMKDGQPVNTTSGLSALLSQLVVDGDEGKNAAKGVNFFCQHGGPECAGNVFESCTQVPASTDPALRGASDSVCRVWTTAPVPGHVSVVPRHRLYRVAILRRGREAWRQLRRRHCRSPPLHIFVRPVPPFAASPPALNLTE